MYKGPREHPGVENETKAIVCTNNTTETSSESDRCFFFSFFFLFLPADKRPICKNINSHSSSITNYFLLILMSSSSELTWTNVMISLAFVLFDIGVSTVFRLGIGLSLLIAGLRCVGQLALVATVLHEVFETKNPWLVFLICCSFVPAFIRHPSGLSFLLSFFFFFFFFPLVILNLLGTFETGTPLGRVYLTS